MHFNIYGLVLLLTAANLSLAGPRLHRDSSEDGVSKSPRSEIGQAGGVKSPDILHSNPIDERSQEESTTEPPVVRQHSDSQSRKRAVARAIDFCPPGTIAVLSDCRALSPQAYQVLCRDSTGLVTMEFGSCLPHEVCVAGRGPVAGGAWVGVRAQCVSNENFVDIASAKLRALGQSSPGSARASR